MSKALNQAVADRIERYGKDDRNCWCRLLYERNGASICDDDANILPDQLGGVRFNPFGVVLIPAVLKPDSSALYPVEFANRPTKAAVQGPQAEELAPRIPMVGSLPVCCARRQRPKGRRTSNSFDEI